MGEKMSKRRQKYGQGRQERIPRVRMVQLAPSRASLTPFCAYYGPAGETCASTTGLVTVLTLPGPPVYVYMACPRHYEAVQQMVQAFLARLAHMSSWYTMSY
jgi:hypothetical protein